MGIIKDFQDYDDDDPEIEFRRNRVNYWLSLKNARKEFMEDRNGAWDEFLFKTWLLEKYGLELNLMGGNITDSYKIHDEKKHLVYILKFM